MCRRWDVLTVSLFTDQSGAGKFPGQGRLKSQWLKSRTIGAAPYHFVPAVLAIPIRYRTRSRTRSVLALPNPLFFFI